MHSSVAVCAKKVFQKLLRAVLTLFKSYKEGGEHALRRHFGGRKRGLAQTPSLRCLIGRDRFLRAGALRVVLRMGRRVVRYALVGALFARNRLATPPSLAEGK